MLKIVEPNEKYMKGYKEAYELTLKKYEDGVIKKHNILFENPDKVNVVQEMLDNRDQSKLPAHFVPSYDFFAVDDDKLIGLVNIRIRLTDNLIRYGGHIGYAVNPKYWGKGYGTKILRIVLETYKDLIEENKILITCDDDNIGSYKIIEANGGVLENKVENEDNGDKFLTRRYWIDKERFK